MCYAYSKGSLILWSGVVLDVYVQIGPVAAFCIYILCLLNKKTFNS